MPALGLTLPPFSSLNAVLISTLGVFRKEFIIIHAGRELFFLPRIVKKQFICKSVVGLSTALASMTNIHIPPICGHGNSSPRTQAEMYKFFHVAVQFLGRMPRHVFSRIYQPQDIPWPSTAEETERSTF